MKDIIICSPYNVPTVCATCKCQDADVRYSWPDGRSPPFFSFPIAHSGKESVTEDKVLSRYDLMGTNYEIFAYTVNFRDHYTTVFVDGKKKYIYDGTKSDTL
jgi:hypothetical protein